jgi:protease II
MALFIPEQAILARYDTTSVYVVEENLTKKIPVSLGVASGNKREIVSELPEGAHIVVEGAYGITENQSVRETYVSE